MQISQKCRCSFAVDHPKVIHKTEYSKWGWFLFTILGLSAKPNSIKFICSVCSETIAINNDPDILKKYIGR